ncbi:DoxX family protein [Glutamicibacter sp.]|uniref:DoxX family protein n=1 Tax=Glutamicibacter sp. TaxID=1931995 RepID=UPI0028BE4976|nr:DoxX family protein [Glutamicibacter sp.]
MTNRNNPLLASAGLLVLRVALGVILTAHGWQKFSQYTIAGTTSSFEQMGIPAASVVAPIVASIELAGGIAVILGVFSRIFAALIALDMLGALFTVHLSAGIFVDQGGYELVAILAAAAIAIALAGPGKFALDHLFFGRKRAGVKAAV